MGYTPRQLGHVNIYVRNAERAREWYEDLLGLHTHGFTPGRAAFMSADIGNSHEIALVEVGEDAAGPQRGQVGLNHMAWYMHSLEDLAELYNRVKDKNIPIERVSDHGHAIGIYIRDMDGNGIELSYEMPAEEWGHDPSGYMIGGTRKGRMPGPWDEMLERPAGATAKGVSWNTPCPASIGRNFGPACRGSRLSTGGGRAGAGTTKQDFRILRPSI